MSIIRFSFYATLAMMYLLGAMGLVITSLSAAAFYWGRWWMFPVQLFVGLFLLAFGIAFILSRKITAAWLGIEATENQGQAE